MNIETEQGNEPAAGAVRTPQSLPETPSDCIKSVRDYFSGSAIFEVPCYQRGYKWSLLKHREGKTHLEKLFTDLKDAYKGEGEYHLQGVTVREILSKGETRIELVDGRRRTNIALPSFALGQAQRNPCRSD